MHQLYQKHKGNGVWQFMAPSAGGGVSLLMRHSLCVFCDEVIVYLFWERRVRVKAQATTLGGQEATPIAHT